MCPLSDIYLRTTLFSGSTILVTSILGFRSSLLASSILLSYILSWGVRIMRHGTMEPHYEHLCAVLKALL
jgi:hypothetical protein